MDRKEKINWVIISILSLFVMIFSGYSIHYLHNETLTYIVNTRNDIVKCCNMTTEGLNVINKKINKLLENEKQK